MDVYNQIVEMNTHLKEIRDRVDRLRIDVSNMEKEVKPLHTDLEEVKRVLHR